MAIRHSLADDLEPAMLVSFASGNRSSYLAGSSGGSVYGIARVRGRIQDSIFLDRGDGRILAERQEVRATTATC